MKSLVVSLHDVSPLTLAVCEKILSELRQIGIGQSSLLIIPNHHGMAPVAEDPLFRDWLVQMVEAGHEPVLHGYFHRRPMQTTDRWYSKLTTEIYTAGEGEFFDLSFESAMHFLAKGLADLSFLNRGLAGFVAPAWLLGKAAEQAVCQSGFVYTTRIGGVRIFPAAAEVNSRSLVWSTRAPWRVGASLIWNGILGPINSSGPVLRVSIHPADFRERPVWEQIRGILSRATQVRECVTYESLVARLCSESVKNRP